ncbi:MAG TPA: glutaminyl-peptide cyclotransferase [Chitinophagaceae bacterium]|nr:glutaminyl-peptide cyclotransferase [Chitinophagaceae bacterium]
MRQRIIALILLLVFTAGGIFYFISKNNSSTYVAPTTPVPVYMQVNIVNSFPHDTSAFTEGLFIQDSILYESTGQKGRSSLRKVELSTGKILKKIDLDAAYFGEGISMLNGKIYQMTYQEHTVFVYDAKNFSLLKKFDLATEGWGMTTDGKNLIVSDGTNFLYYYDPETFKEIKKVSVQDNNGLLTNINELEWIDGYIYSNVWQTNYILKINPDTGLVVAKADVTQQIQAVLPTGFDLEMDVLNGIAYDKDTKKIYITGKNWPKLLEVTFN